MASSLVWWRATTRLSLSLRHRTTTSSCVGAARRLLSHRTPVSVYESLVAKGSITDNASQRVVLTGRAHACLPSHRPHPAPAALKKLFNELDDYKPSLYFEADAEAKKTVRMGLGFRVCE